MKTINLLIPKLAQEITFLIGSNAQDNVNIITSSKPSDIWFHVADYPSAHVVAQIPETLIDVPNKTLLPIITQGAVICKQVSKYANKGKLQITYTKILNVHPTDTVGTVSLSTSKAIFI
jgi:predicted ribosome quality control (RQC) complex YloA/Tae2 family protein